MHRRLCACRRAAIIACCASPGRWPISMARKKSAGCIWPKRCRTGHWPRICGARRNRKTPARFDRNRFSELRGLSRWRRPIRSHIVRVVPVEQILPQDTTARGDDDVLVRFPARVGWRRFCLIALCECRHREGQRTRYNQQHYLLHREAPQKTSGCPIARTCFPAESFTKDRNARDNDENVTATG